MRLGLLLSLALAGPAAALDVPFMSGRVNDHAGLLSAAARESLEAELKDFEARTGHQLAVLTLASLEGAPLEDFSLQVARTWALGRKGKNDGVLFLVARDDRKLRIEVGHGLEGGIPDALAGRIIHDAITPRFRAGDFEGGIQNGVDAIIAAAQGSYAPPERSRRSGRNDFAELGLLEKLLVSAFILGLLGLFEFVGVAAPGMGWFLYFFLIPFWAAFPMAIWGAKIGLGCLTAHLLGFPILKSLLPRTEFGRKIRVKGGRHVYYGGAPMFTLGGGGGGGGSGGGFSGGGGSFGGGGASGSW
ncbi:MAG: TPM domain-containing protein [Elusimicrobia bacterium]|nr:TPM domain-containing protein [Elusimicrobiota bacterium]